MHYTVEYMTRKNILIGIAIIIVLILGFYFLIYRVNSGKQANTQGQAQTQNNNSQVQGQDVTVGKGAQAVPGATVSVLYVGKLQDGTVFDSSEAHGNKPLSFTLGTQGLIPGFQIGVNGMKEGGERLLSIPPTLGYGSQDIKDPSGKLIIPANSTLIFDVKLISVQASSTSPIATPSKKGKK